MIALAIGGIDLGMSAPLISKQIQNNSLNNIQFNVLNQKINEINGSKWTRSQFAENITKETGNVGIGIEKTSNPTAKLDIINNNINQSGFSLTVPNTMLEYIFNIKKGLLSVFSITSSGRVEVKNGLNIGLPYKGGVNFLATYSYENSTPHHVMYRNGTMLIQPAKTATWSAFSVKNANNDNSLAEEYKSGVKIYKNDGIQLLSSGGIRMNYDDEINPGTGGPFAMFVRGNRRLEINEAGRVIFFYAKGAPETGENKTVFHIIGCENECGNNYTPSTYFLIDVDGTVSIPNTLKVAGKSVTASLEDLDPKYANLNNELIDSKQLIAESKKIINDLKTQNEILIEKITILKESSQHTMLNETKKQTKANTNNSNNIISAIFH